MSCSLLEIGQNSSKMSQRTIERANQVTDRLRTIVTEWANPFDRSGCTFTMNGVNIKQWSEKEHQMANCVTPRRIMSARAGHARAGQVRSGQNRSGQDRSGQVMSGQVRQCHLSQVRSRLGAGLGRVAEPYSAPPQTPVICAESLPLPPRRSGLSVRPTGSRCRRV